MEGRFKNFDLSLSIMNCYGPYKERESFWDHLEPSGLLGINNLIVVDDLNLTLPPVEIWGNNARLDLVVD